MSEPASSIEVSGRPRADAEALVRALQREGYAAREAAEPSGCFLPGVEFLLPVVAGAGARLGVRLTERLEDQAVDKIADIAASKVQDKLAERRGSGTGVVTIYGPHEEVLKEVKVRKDRIART